MVNVLLSISYFVYYLGLVDATVPQGRTSAPEARTSLTQPVHVPGHPFDP